jgi:hypothetical protein
MLTRGVRVQLDGIGQAPDVHRLRCVAQHRQEPGTADAGQDPVSLLDGSHACILHGNSRKYQVPRPLSPKE